MKRSFRTRWSIYWNYHTKTNMWLFLVYEQLHLRKSLGGTIKVLDFVHFVICLRDPWVKLAAKILVSVYGYQDIAIWKVDKMQTEILQARILNGYNFWLADRNDLKLSTHELPQKASEKNTIVFSKSIMADIESIRLANCFDFSQLWSWF